ncbi:pentatricopeptide repeat-containing protein [Canna indica]|uniref:Pentatricopeptide repeat-containing protein n=1 Tax=Canna indica TaxID=4628 RepID=A0AAQ3QBJ6_9LILI|nr:pentatricopeptide repeat-containing protein [Canna indica]
MPAPGLSPAVATTLIKTLCRRRSFALARQVFDQMPDPDVVAWTALLSGYASNGCPEDALATFRRMLSSGVCPNRYTASSVLTACRGLRSRRAGSAVHGTAARRGIGDGAYVENALLDLYASCGCIADAETVFGEMTERTVSAWTTIHASSSIGCVTIGRQLHAFVMKAGYDSNLPVANALLDMYSRCMNSSPAAKKLFDEMPQKDLITWNAMIASLERCNSHEALLLFLEMESHDMRPCSFTYSSIVAACANLATLNFGQQVHASTIRRGYQGNLQVANALVDMYAKCGSIANSRKVFDDMAVRDLISWTSLLTGYGMNGYGQEAIELFEEMMNVGLQPDYVLLMGVLTACSHAGLVDEGLRYFRLMSTEYNVPPNKEVYGCVIDLLGRAERITEAYELIETMPLEPDEAIWGALLGACKMHKNVHLGRLAAHKILEMKPNDPKTFVLLSNIYAAGNAWGDFAETMRSLRGQGKKKEVGMSWIEVRNEVCSFAANDRSSHHVASVYEVLQELLQHMNQDVCELDSNWLLHDFSDVA